MLLESPISVHVQPPRLRLGAQVGRCIERCVLIYLKSPSKIPSLGTVSSEFLNEIPTLTE